MRPVPLATILGVIALAGTALATPARADTLILGNGDYVVGELDVREIPLATRDGVVRVGPREVRRVTLGTIGGDVIAFRQGGGLIGLVEQATYAVRLPSGQTVVFGRRHIATIVFHAR